MGHNRIGVGDIDHRRKQLRAPRIPARPSSAGSRSVPKPARLSAIDLIEGILVVEVSVLGAGGDIGEQIGPLGEPGRIG